MKHSTDEEIQQFVANELDGAALLSIREHLHNCEVCKQTALQYTAIEKAFNKVPEESAAPDIEKAILKKIQLAKQRHRSQQKVFFSILAVLFSGIFSFCFAAVYLTVQQLQFSADSSFISNSVAKLRSTFTALPNYFQIDISLMTSLSLAASIVMITLFVIHEQRRRIGQ